MNLLQIIDAFRQPAFGGASFSSLYACIYLYLRWPASGRLAWIVLAGIRLAGGRRPPLITHCSCGRPKVTCVRSLSIFSPAFTSNSSIASRNNSTEDICVQIPFGPPLAGGLHILRIPSWASQVLRGPRLDTGFRLPKDIHAVRKSPLADAQKDLNGHHVEPNYCHADSSKRPRDTKDKSTHP